MADTESVKQDIGTETETQEKTFTQSELDEIVQSRLAKEKRAMSKEYEAMAQKASKYDELEQANKSELQKATERADELQKQLDKLNKETEVRNIRAKIASDTGVPADLLWADTEEECTKQAQAILGFAKKNDTSYPAVKDGGEVTVSPTKKTNGQLFSDWLTEQLT